MTVDAGPPRRLPTAIAARQPFAAVVEQARVVESLGYDGLWIPEVLGRDAVTLCAVLAQHTEAIELATGVVPLPRRTPVQLAMAAATAAEAAPGRFRLGVGIGHGATLGPGWDGPLRPTRLAHAERGLRAVRALLDGSEAPLRLRGVPTIPGRPPIVLAALSPGLARVAARAADGLVLNWLTPERAAVLAAAYRDAADAPGPVFAYVPVCVTDDAGAAFVALARQVAAYGALPAYARSLARCGLQDGVADLVAGAAPRPGSTARRALEALGAIGAPDAVTGRLAAFRAAGVVPVIAPVPAGEDGWASLMTTWTALAPAGSV